MTAPNLPSRPTRPSQGEPPRGNWLGLLLAFGAALVIFSGLLLLTGGYLGLVLLVGGGVFGLAALHYVVWGWWLSKILHEEEAADSARQDSARQDGARREQAERDRQHDGLIERGPKP